jgi:hypothetical protein
MRSIVSLDGPEQHPINASPVSGATVVIHSLSLERGKDNFAADRVAAEQVIEVRPAIRTDVRANRACLGRAVRYLAGPAGSRMLARC